MDIQVLVTPGLGLTLICETCSPHVEIFTDSFDAEWKKLVEIVDKHKREFHDD